MLSLPVRQEGLQSIKANANAQYSTEPSGSSEAPPTQVLAPIPESRQLCLAIESAANCRQTLAPSLCFPSNCQLLIPPALPTPGDGLCSQKGYGWCPSQVPRKNMGPSRSRGSCRAVPHLGGMKWKRAG